MAAHVGAAAGFKAHAVPLQPATSSYLSNSLHERPLSHATHSLVVGAKLGVEVYCAVGAQEDALGVVLRQDLEVHDLWQRHKQGVRRSNAG